MRYISEQLTKETIKGWKNGSNIIITAPTGSGKSSWVRNVLNKERNNILILVNRSKLKEQLLEDFEDSNIDIRTYQSIEKNIRKGNDCNLSKYSTIVCDEAHYFISDSGFNHFTDLSLNAVLNSKALRIFMSATIEEIKEYFDENGVKIDDIQSFNFNSNISKVYTYKSTSTIIKYFNSTDDKSIMFSNIQELENINNMIKNSSIVVSDYSNKRYLTNKETINGIVKNNVFDKKILLTTTALDNGVSIKDINVKSIVIDLYDPITIKQAIGRLRFEENTQAIEIVIRNRSRRSISALIRINEEILDGVNLLRESESEYLEKYNRLTYKHNRCIYPDVKEGKTIMMINEIAVFKLLKDLEFLYMVKNSIEDGTGDFSSHIIKYLKLDNVNVNNLKEKFDMANVDLILSSFTGRYLFKEDKEELSSQLKPYLSTAKSRKDIKIFNLTFINAYLDQFNHKYILNYKRVMNNGKRVRVWEVKEISVNN